MHRSLFAIVLGVLLAAPSAFAASAANTEAERQLDMAQRLIAASPMQLSSALKEITRDCVPVPLPTTITGPSWTFDVLTGVGASVRGTAWRRPCAGNDAQLILTLQPLQGTPFVCGTEIELQVGAARTDDLFLDVNPNDGVGTSFCGNLSATTSFVLFEFDNAFAFDDDSAFTLIYESNVGPDASINIAAYDPSQYGGGTTNLTIGGRLSGSYYATARSGEGIILEIGTVGTRRVLFLAWFTYFQGQQRWIFGSVDLTAGATQATVPLNLTSGGQFGAAFNPTQVTVTPWGSATVQFPSCTTMRFQWSETGGASGSYDYVRGLDGLDGVSCN